MASPTPYRERGRINRRRLLQGIATGTVLGSAGCNETTTDDGASGGDDSGAGGTVTPEPTTTPVPSGGSDSVRSPHLGGVSMRAVAERMDHVRPPDRLRGAERRLRADAPPNDFDVDGWHQGGATAKSLAGDFGLYHATNKGILDVHRAESTSIGAVAERHGGSQSTTHEVLAFNTYLVADGGGEDEARSMDIGRMLGREGFDLVCLCEVFDGEDGQRIYDRTVTDGRQWAEAFGPPDGDVYTSGGLYGLVAEDERTLVDSEWDTYSDGGEGWDEFARKGWLHMAVDLGPGVLDVFLTHTDADQEDSESRYDQIVELTDAIAAHQQAHPNHVTMAVGDFNVYSSNAEYPQFLERMWDSCGMRDLWLTRGGHAGATHDIDNYCTYSHPACECDDYHGEDDPDEGNDWGSNRLDYAFLQDPRPEHDMHVDVTRVRRRPFPRKEPCGDVDPGADIDERFMSDHLGLALTLVASPRP